VYRRWLWPGFAFPGVLWLILLFAVPFYAVVAVAFGSVDPIFGQPVPLWNPLEWNVGWISEVLDRISPGGNLFGVAIRTLEYVAIALGLSIAIGYPVAYYIARHAGRMKNILLVLIILPLWISYLMRMLAWVNLLALDGYVNRFLTFTHVLSQPRDWLGGQSSTVILALVYGYIPYFILPLSTASTVATSKLPATSAPARGPPSAPSPFRSRRPGSSAAPSSSPCRCSATTTRRTSSPARRRLR
jgi:putrescine transport system permease protein